MKKNLKPHQKIKYLINFFVKNFYHNFLEIKTNIESKTLCADIGNYSSYIYKQEDGLILRNEASLISLVKEGDLYVPYLFGNKAKEMIGKVPFDIKIEKILNKDKITDADLFQDFVNHYTDRDNKNPIKKRIIISTNSQLTQNEKINLTETIERCGFFNVSMIPEIISSAIGCGINIKKPNSFIVVNIGYSKTETAIVTLGFVIKSKITYVGGHTLDLDIKEYLLHKYNIITTDDHCEQLKKLIGSVFSADSIQKQTSVYGRDVNSGKIKSIVVRNEDISIAIARSVLKIATDVKSIIDNAPSDFIMDIKNFGILLCGGSANLKNIDLLISQVTKLPTFIIPKPEEANIRGLSIVANNFNLYKSIIQSFN